MHPLPTKAGSGISLPAPKETITLEIQRIRRDGGTQGRVSLNQSVVDEYAELMKAGTEFPPVRVWFDGNNYWLSDGFQRVAAAESIGVKRIAAEILSGSLEDARWDCYAANSRHGLRRTPADIALVIEGALQHPEGSQLSNNQIAQHLNIPEATLRRWRKRLSSSNGEDTTRMAVRDGKAYCIEITKIGKAGGRRSNRPNSWTRLRQDLRSINDLASPKARAVLRVIDTWVNGDASSTVFLEGIEMTIAELHSPGALKATTRAS
jgi:hypothetical protein